MDTAVYSPSEDSELLLQAAKGLLAGGKIKSVLEIGTGSGCIIKGLESEAERLGLKCPFFATDIRKEAISEAGKNTKAKLILAGLFEGIKGKFGLILFNPPYLPPTEDDYFLGEFESSVVNKGVIERFIKSAGSYLSKNGVCLLLMGSVTGRERMERLMKESGLEFSVVKSKALFFERLFVYGMRKR